MQEGTDDHNRIHPDIRRDRSAVHGGEDMKPPVFNYADYEAVVKQHEETANLLSDVLRDNARLKAENEALKTDLRVLVSCPSCKNFMSDKCKECMFDIKWEWRGVRNG